ncbi:MAG: DUF523 domain-containing protein [Coriobacteriia bacterium]|nr:DUF523 domain-containing protein [Coriobacteriia bacterium]MCL2536885.1 DUF523 domain-containing protein [Coriobacteriia bacterium]
MTKIIVSSCLLGKCCRYDGRDSLSPLLVEELDEMCEPYLDVCPEVLGGLSTPRSRAEIVGGCGKEVLAGTAKVLTQDGLDVTNAFVAGAMDVLRLCKKRGVRTAFLKAKSPSCGAGQIYDGSFTGTLRDGNGVTAELLIQNGIKVISVE